MIEFKNVSFHYGGEQGTGEGVDNINLSIGTGEVVVLKAWTIPASWKARSG